MGRRETCSSRLFDSMETIKKRRYRRLTARQMKVLIDYLFCYNYFEVARKWGVSRQIIHVQVRRDAKKFLDILEWTNLNDEPIDIDVALKEWGPQIRDHAVLYLRRLEYGHNGSGVTATSVSNGGVGRGRRPTNTRTVHRDNRDDHRRIPSRRRKSARL